MLEIDQLKSLVLVSFNRQQAQPPPSCSFEENWQPCSCRAFGGNTSHSRTNPNLTNWGGPEVASQHRFSDSRRLRTPTDEKVALPAGWHSQGEGGICHTRGHEILLTMGYYGRTQRVVAKGVFRVPAQASALFPPPQPIQHGF